MIGRSPHATSTFPSATHKSPPSIFTKPLLNRHVSTGRHPHVRWSADSRCFVPGDYRSPCCLGSGRSFQKCSINSRNRHEKKRGGEFLCEASDVGALEDPLPDGNRGLWGWRFRTLKQILLFALPALAIPLADPLLSLVDTVCVAQCAGTVELASLGPNTAIFNFANYTFNSLGLATMTIVAERLKSEGPKEASKDFSTALLMSLVFGVLSMAVLLAFGGRIITSSGVDPAVGSFSLEYLNIRAFAQPAALAILVCQAGLLAQKDSFTPFLTVGVACLVNIVGDVLLIKKFKMGVAGAALATVFAEYCEVLIMLYVLATRGKVKPWIDQIPSRARLKNLMSVFLPLSAEYFCKGGCYVLIQWTAAGLQLMALAVHQVTYAWWNLCAFCQTPVEHSGLAFIPAAKSRRERVEVSALTIAFGCFTGVATGILAAAAPFFFPGWFSPDKTLWPLMKTTAPFALLSLCLSGVDVGMMAILYTNRDGPFVARTMFTNLAMIAAYLLGCVKMGWGLYGVWGGLVLFFLMRATWSSVRVFSRHMSRGGDVWGEGASHA
ncbi:hypothetical protein BSKO_09352 [Bryopsis sp. KO-2023]|nr:hypothetical protein BSKO_09352 [Bryopsis sp. KO-2023]